MNNDNKEVPVSAFAPLIGSTAGYQRAACSVCGEGLGFTEGDPCDRCDDFDSAQRFADEMRETVKRIREKYKA